MSLHFRLRSTSLEAVPVHSLTFKSFPWSCSSSKHYPTKSVRLMPSCFQVLFCCGRVPWKYSKQAAILLNLRFLWTKVRKSSQNSILMTWHSKELCSVCDWLSTSLNFRAQFTTNNIRDLPGFCGVLSSMWNFSAEMPFLSRSFIPTICWWLFIY